jgi:serine/threonine protein kinase
LPGDKAIEIARKLCAGLAAAHDKDVLHRDLKPANVMIDGRGQVLIRDFGLAAPAGQLEGTQVRDGTPAYVAPEQLAGKEVSIRSDIYALGLVLHEMFTGMRALENGSERPTPTAVSSLGNELTYSLTADFSTWYASTTVFLLVVILALTAYAFHTAMAGRPLFKAGFLEPD